MCRYKLIYFLSHANISLSSRPYLVGYQSPSTSDRCGAMDPQAKTASAGSADLPLNKGYNATIDIRQPSSSYRYISNRQKRSQFNFLGTAFSAPKLQSASLSHTSIQPTQCLSPLSSPRTHPRLSQASFPKPSSPTAWSTALVPPALTLSHGSWSRVTSKPGQ